MPSLVERKCIAAHGMSWLPDVSDKHAMSCLRSWDLFEQCEPQFTPHVEMVAFIPPEMFIKHCAIGYHCYL